jgi:hypothetical protein
VRRFGYLMVMSCVAALAVTLPGPSFAAAPANLVANPGFEAAHLSDHSTVWGWSCEGGVSQLGAPHTGARSLAGSPTDTATARCVQAVPVQPGTTYTLAAWVRGGYAFLGSDFGVIWTPPTGEWTRIATTFTAVAPIVEIYLHGWYAAGAFEADDVTLTGPDSSVRTPAAPVHIAPYETTSRSQRLTWIASPGATGYRIYQQGVLVRSVTEPQAVIDGLTPATSYAFRVAAVNSAGESGRSLPVEIHTAQPYSQVPAQVRLVVGTPHAYHAWLAWEAVQTATDGYRIYQDGVLIGWSHGPAFTVTGLRHGTLYTFEVTGLNSAGESARSRPIQVYTWQIPG